MNRRGKIFGVTVLLVLLVFAAGVVHLMRLRFQRGDAFPPYSSLRTDPIGCKALFESLERMPAASVRRNYGPPEKLGDKGPLMVFWLGATVHGLDAPVPVTEFESIERIAAAGGRVVLTFNPVGQDPANLVPTGEGVWEDYFPAPKEEDEEEEDGAAEPEEEEDGPESSEAEEAAAEDTAADTDEDDEDDEDEDKRRGPDWTVPKVSLEDRWGCRLEYRDLERSEARNYVPVPAYRQVGVDLPEQITCHSAMYFGLDADTTPWRTIYQRGRDMPVVIERDFGPGTIVLCNDSYLLSNEALRSERQPTLLTWLVGRPNTRDGYRTRIVFDESHLGVQAGAGVVSLARRYRLHGVAAGLALLAILFVWRNACSLVPSYDEALGRREAQAAPGKDSAQGLNNLLRRSIGSGDLLDTCLDEYQKSCIPDSRLKNDKKMKRKLQKMRRIIADEKARPWRERNTPAAYQALCRILAEEEPHSER